VLFAIFGHDVEDSLARRLEARPAHIARLAALDQQGRLHLAGPFPRPQTDATSAGFSGSLIVADFDTLESAKDWAKTDPYVEQGVYERVEIFPFKKVFPAS
jgi:uncharacterized protein